uniref:Uncharacterized protein n=1 Tax=Arundo donax TaxID=35708 RepID=A0A0A9G1Y5_ARUDO
MGRRRGHDEAPIDLDSDKDVEESKSKRPRTHRTTTVKTSGSSKNVLPSFYDNVSQNRSLRNATSRRNKANQDKLDTDIFELYMEDLWKRIDEDKKSAYAYFDSLWFNMYNSGLNKLNVLKWIKAKRIFSRQYVFVPIVCWWVPLIITFCNHLFNCQIGIKFPLFFTAGDTGAYLSYATLTRQTARTLRKAHE